MDIDELITQAKQWWSNQEKLSLLLLDIIQLHRQTAQDLGNAIASYASAFVAEKEDGYKMTIAEAEHKAKAATGGQHEVLRAQLQTLVMLHQSVSDRNDQLVSLSQNKPS